MDVCKRCRNAFANRRQAAFIIDSILWRIADWIITVSVAVLIESTGRDPFETVAAFELMVTCLSIAVSITFIFKDSIKGISPGKWLFGVQVIDSTTREPIGFRQSAKRNLITLVPLIGILVPAFQMRRGPRWGDGWAKTVVIWRKHAHKPPFDPRGILCTTCGYDLTGNVSGICPECGTPIPTKPAPPATAPETQERKS